MAIQEWPAALRSAGITVRLHNGFPNNDLGRPMPKKIASVFWHHDASPKGYSPGALEWITNSYNSKKPSAQIWVDYQGVWYFVGAGYASHAGTTRGPLGSHNSVGVETDHTVDEPMSPALLASLQLGFAAIAIVEGRNADFVTFHKIEVSPRGRKPDPFFSGNNAMFRWDTELATQRSIIQGHIDRLKGNPPPVELDWDEMATEEQIRRIVREEVAAGVRSIKEGTVDSAHSLRTTAERVEQVRDSMGKKLDAIKIATETRLDNLPKS